MSATVTPDPKAKKKRSPRLAAETRTEVVDRLNDHHALILLGDRPVVLREGTGPDGRDEIRLLSVSGFHEWTRPDVIWLGDGENEPVRKVQASKLWVDDERRRQYDGLVFDPVNQVPRGYYNLWKGWAVEPAPAGSPASCQRFIDHIAENVCAGDEPLFAWVMGWFASLIQHPTRKLGTSLVLRGTQGTGKTIVGQHIGSLLGHHYALVADSRYIVGRFNSHLANCLLLQLDEATWGGDHAAAGKLKDLITGEYQYIEYKGREPVKVKNYVRLLVTGNNNWLVPAGLEERRFAVLDVGEGKRQDSRYFQAIEDEMNAGGREALLRYLLDFDLTDVPLRSIPSTMALAEQKVSSMSHEQHWWLDLLNRGALPGDFTGEGLVEVQELYTSYITHLHRMGVQRKVGETEFGMKLRKLAPGVLRHRRAALVPGGKRPWIYEFPPLAQCRREFARLTGDVPSSTDAPERWQEDIHRP